MGLHGRVKVMGARKTIKTLQPMCEIAFLTSSVNNCKNIKVGCFESWILLLSSGKKGKRSRTEASSTRGAQQIGFLSSSPLFA
jgi:hypothetical protein